MGVYIDFAYVKENADFATILGAYDVALKGNGDERRACCPFHDDENPSLTVNLADKVFCCHAASCGEKGNVLEFVAKMESVDLRSASHKIGELCNIDLAPPRRRRNGGNGSARKASNDRRSSPATDKPAEKVEPGTNKALTFRLRLDRSHKYGASRGFSPELCDQFEMGFCNRGMMKDRWCVPIHNIEREVVAYVGRWVGDGDPPGDEPKWKNPPNFHRNQELFNLHRAENSFVVLVEGVFDAIRLHGLGIPAVAMLGSSLSVEQIELLKVRGYNAVTVMLDGGTKKATDDMVAVLSRDFYTRAVDLPEDVDPGNATEELIEELVGGSYGVG